MKQNALARPIPWAIALLSALILVWPARAAELPATPATLGQVLATASAGDTLVLAEADYGTVSFPFRTFSPRLIVDATKAKFVGLVLTKVAGVEIRGGSVNGPGGKSFGILIRESRDIRIADMRVGGAHRGIMIDRSEDVVLFGNTLEGLITDGIDIAFSTRVHIEKNSCRNFKPIPAVYDKNGRLLQDGDHPDCIQAWSRPQFKPTSNLTIIDNEMLGPMQGIFLGNHIRNGVDDGGFDNVVIRNNRLKTGMPNGIYIQGARNAEIVDNTIETTPGATMPNPPHRPVKAKLYFVGTNVKACGNIVGSVPRGPGTQKC